MSRPFPWLPKLNKIRATVAQSVRSHYSRRELELLFGVSARAAGRLLEMLATEPIGTAHMVSKDSLTSFLDQVSEVDDVAALCSQRRSDQENLTRVKARYLVRRDYAETSLGSLPEGIFLEPGCLTIRYASLEDLCDRMMMTVNAMACNPLEFEAICDPPRVRSAEDEYWERENAETRTYLAAELERRRNAKNPPAEAGGLVPVSADEIHADSI